VEIIPNCGHFLQEDKSKELTEIITSFLNEQKRISLECSRQLDRFSFGTSKK